MDDLVAFLRAQLDDDERVARSATSGPWSWVDPGGKVKSALVGPGYPYQTVVPAAGGDVYPSVHDAEHIARHDPARVLAEVDAKRRIVDWLAEDAAFDMPAAKAQAASREEWYLVTVARTTIKMLALPYAAHPDYRAEWAVANSGQETT